MQENYSRSPYIVSKTHPYFAKAAETPLEQKLLCDPKSSSNQKIRSNKVQLSL